MIEWYVLTLVAAVFGAINVVIRKKLLFKEHATEYLTSIYLVGAIVLVPFIYLVDFSASLNVWLLICLKTIIFSVALLLAVKSAKHMEVSYQQPLGNLTPVFLIILSFIFLGDVVTLKQGIGVFLILVSAYAIELKEHSFKLKLKKNKYLVYFLIALFLSAFLAILDRMIIHQTTVYTLLIAQVYLTLIFLLFIQFFKYKGLKDIKFALKTGKWWILVIVLVGFLAEISYLKAVAIPTALISLIVIVRRTSSLMSTIIGGELFHEKNLTKKVLATIVMLIGVYLVVA